MTVYLDIVWLLNLLMDGIILYLTAWILKRKVTRKRLAIGAFIASLIVLFLFTPMSPVFYHPLGKVAYSALIVWIVFGYRRFAMYFQAFFMFYFIAFAMGGGLFGLHYILRSSAFYADFLRFSTLKYGDPISWVLVIVGIPVIFWFSKKRMDHVVVRKFRYEQLAQVTIYVQDQVIRAKGFVDTGNNLYHPVNQAPVIFINRYVSDGLFPDEFFEPHAADLLEDIDLMDGWQKKLTLIPFRSVGHSDYILAIKPDVAFIDLDGERYQTKTLYVAFSQDSFSAEDDFNCILHPDTVQLGKLVGTAS